MADLFERLQNNKGTVSSVLGKAIAKEILDSNDKELINEAVNLVSYQIDNKKEKSIRAGAAKIVEKVAEKKPELVEGHLEQLFKGLDAAEAQTRWMVIRIFGFCAELNAKEADKAYSYAEKFVEHKEGVCLTGATAYYLGEVGKLNRDYAKKSFGMIKKAADNIGKNEEAWLLEAYTQIVGFLEREEKDEAIAFAHKYIDSPTKSTCKRADKLIEKASE